MGLKKAYGEVEAHCSGDGGGLGGAGGLGGEAFARQHTHLLALPAQSLSVFNCRRVGSRRLGAVRSARCAFAQEWFGKLAEVLVSPTGLKVGVRSVAIRVVAVARDVECGGIRDAHGRMLCAHAVHDCRPYGVVRLRLVDGRLRGGRTGCGVRWGRVV